LGRRISGPLCDACNCPQRQDKFAGWVTARFGKRLYGHFFKSYTEKVWGMPADELPADWAAQRIKNLDLKAAILNALTPKRNQKEITSLIEEFQYPKYGPGMMWEVCRDKVEAQGTKVVMESPVVRIRHVDGKAVAIVAMNDGVMPGHRTTLSPAHPSRSESTWGCMPRSTWRAAFEWRSTWLPR